MSYVKYAKGGIWWCKQSCVKGVDDPYLPMVIVSEASDPCGKCYVTVVPIKPTRILNQDEMALQYAVPINVKESGYAICNELKTLSTDRLETYEGQCTDDTIKDINKMISMYLNLSLLSAAESVTTSATFNPYHVDDDKPKEVIIDAYDMEAASKNEEGEKPNFKKDIPDELDLGTEKIENTYQPNGINFMPKISEADAKKLKSKAEKSKKDNQKKSDKTEYISRSHGKGAGNGTPIYCVTNHKWYVSMYAAMQDTHVNSKKIKRYLDNGAKGKVDGYVFSYKKEYEKH